MSIGEQLAKGNPVVFIDKDDNDVPKGIPKVVCKEGKEKEALELMEKMELIELVRPVEGENVISAHPSDG